MRIRRAFSALVLTVTITSTAAAQSWESPTFFAPGAHDDVGLYLIKAEGTDELGWAALWRQSGNINLGVRAGLAPGAFDWLLGAEFYGPLNLFASGSQFLASWMVSAGAIAGEDGAGNDAVALRIPAGVSFGVTLGSDQAIVVPYVFPRVALDLRAIGEGDDEETNTDINLDVDLGADVTLDDRFVVRAGLTIGEFTTVGIGFAYRIPRRVIVR